MEGETEEKEQHPHDFSQEVVVKSVDNGFIVKGINGNGNYSTQVYEYDEFAEENTEKYLQTERDMLYAVKEFLGLYGSKHNPARLHIEIEKQNQE